jgi:hypothetical protein
MMDIRNGELRSANRMTTYSNIKQNTVLTDDDLRMKAPSIFAIEPWERMSARYTFIPTIEIVNRMRSEGFQPVSAVQSRTRIEGKSDFTKHMIRFRDMRNGDAPAILSLGTIYPELILTNSHDGASAYKIDAGLFRLICLNGMMVSQGNVEQVNVRHSGGSDGIIEASYQVVEQFPKVIDSVERFSRLRLNAPQANAFAEAALSLRYDENESPITPAQLIAPKRREDMEPTMWNTLNVTQEHLIRGGDRGRNVETHRRVKTRAVTSIGENARLNKALWMLADKMAELVTA